MKSTLTAISFILLCLVSHGQSLPDLSNAKSEKIFNGKNLDGWYQIVDNKVSDKSLFAAENETIHAYPVQAAGSTQSFGALITEREFENYVLTLEYKWGERKFKPRDLYVRDAGVMIHMSGQDVIWPSGIECQIQEGDTGDLWVIKSRASSTVHPVNKNYDVKGEIQTLGSLETEYNRFPRSFCWEQPGWNKVVLVIKGDRATFYINDKLVNVAMDMKKWDGQGNWIPLTKGKILLQAEGSEIFYRNIKVQMLQPE